MYHGILLNVSFGDPVFIEQFKTFARKEFVSSSWIVVGVLIPDELFQQKIKEIQQNMKAGKYYNHIYNDKELIVIFKNKVFFVKPHKSTWTEVIIYAQSIGIPEVQIDFWPNRFQDEQHYFSNID